MAENKYEITTHPYLLGQIRIQIGIPGEQYVEQEL